MAYDRRYHVAMSAVIDGHPAARVILARALVGLRAAGLRAQAKQLRADAIRAGYPAK